MPALNLTPPPGFLADAALRPILDALEGARVVGGCVRDALAGRPIADIDLATPDPPETVMAALGRAGLRCVPTGLAHGTVTAVSGHRGFEITSLRRDVETDGRRARVAFTHDWREDAARRDFTINALSMTRDGAVHDYFDGLADLRAGRVRFVGDPVRRIAEDHLRILRFFRFFALFARGRADPAAVAAIAAAGDGVARLSAERVWSELRRLLAVPDPLPALRLMQQTGLLAILLPEGFALDRLAGLLAGGAPADPLLRLAGLLTGDAAGFARRLRLSAAEAARLTAWHAGPALPAAADDDALRRALADAPADILAGRVWLAGGDPALAGRISALQRPVFPLRGRDLRAAGLAQDAALGALLQALRDWWLAGGCRADAAACRAELRRRLAPAADA
jgi:poly(A) polymerase/tRNA nucleotidyltransferase (CCA-adding enzyme)